MTQASHGMSEAERAHWEGSHVENAALRAALEALERAATRPLTSDRQVNAPTAHFFVAGKPVPQGSKRAIPHRSTGRIVMLDDPVNLSAWRTQVAWSARAAWKGDPTTAPVRLVLRFVLPRPKAMRGEAPRHTKKPDGDKLARAALDSMTSIIYRDDSQVDSLDAGKRYASEQDPPGLHVEVWTD